MIVPLNLPLYIEEIETKFVENGVNLGAVDYYEHDEAKTY